MRRGQPPDPRGPPVTRFVPRVSGTAGTGNPTPALRAALPSRRGDASAATAAAPQAIAPFAGDDAEASGPQPVSVASSPPGTPVRGNTSATPAAVTPAAVTPAQGVTSLSAPPLIAPMLGAGAGLPPTRAGTPASPAIGQFAMIGASYFSHVQTQMMELGQAADDRIAELQNQVQERDRQLTTLRNALSNKQVQTFAVATATMSNLPDVIANWDATQFMGGALQLRLLDQHASAVCAQRTLTHDFSVVPARLPPQHTTTHPKFALDFLFCVPTNVWDPMTQNPVAFRDLVSDPNGWMCKCMGRDTGEDDENDATRAHRMGTLRERMKRKGRGEALYFATTEGVEIFTAMRYACKDCGCEVSAASQDFLRIIQVDPQYATLKAEFPVVKLGERGGIIGKSLATTLHRQLTTAASFHQAVATVQATIRETYLAHEIAVMANLLRFNSSIINLPVSAAGAGQTQVQTQLTGAMANFVQVARTRQEPTIHMATESLAALHAFFAAVDRKERVLKETLHTDKQWREMMHRYAQWETPHSVWIADNIDLGGFNVMCADHTFKLARAVVHPDGIHFPAVFTVWNMHGEVLAQKFCTDLTAEEYSPVLERLQLRLKAKMREEEKPLDAPMYFIVDNCCQMRNSIKKAMPEFTKLRIKLDPYHWFLRWDRRTTLKGTPEGEEFMSLLRRTVYSWDEPGKPARIKCGLDTRLNDLRTTREYQAAEARCGTFSAAFKSLVMHAYCLEDPDNFTAEQLEKYRRSTNEQYHCGVNRNVRGPGRTSAAHIAAALMSHNINITLNRLASLNRVSSPHCPIVQGVRNLSLLNSLAHVSAAFERAAQLVGQAHADAVGSRIHRYMSDPMQRLSANAPNLVDTRGWTVHLRSMDAASSRPKTVLEYHFGLDATGARRKPPIPAARAEQLAAINNNVFVARSRDGEPDTAERPRIHAITDCGSTPATVKNARAREDSREHAALRETTSRIFGDVAGKTVCLRRWVETAGLPDSALVENESLPTMFEDLVDRVVGLSATDFDDTSMSRVDQLEGSRWSWALATFAVANWDRFGGADFPNFFGTHDKSIAARARIFRQKLSANHTQTEDPNYIVAFHVLAITFRAVAALCDALVVVFIPAELSSPGPPRAIIFPPPEEPRHVFAVELAPFGENLLTPLTLPPGHAIALRLIMAPTFESDLFVELVSGTLPATQPKAAAEAGASQTNVAIEGDLAALQALQRDKNKAERLKQGEAAQREEWGPFYHASSKLTSNNFALTTLIGHCLLLALRDMREGLNTAASNAAANARSTADAAALDPANMEKAAAAVIAECVAKEAAKDATTNPIGGRSPQPAFDAAFAKFEVFVTGLGGRAQVDDKGKHANKLARALRLGGVPAWTQAQVERKWNAMKAADAATAAEMLTAPADPEWRKFPGRPGEQFPDVKRGDIMWATTLESLAKTPLVNVFQDEEPFSPWQVFREIAHWWSDLGFQRKKTQEGKTKPAPAKRKANAQVAAPSRAQPQPPAQPTPGEQPSAAAPDTDEFNYPARTHPRVANRLLPHFDPAEEE